MSVVVVDRDVELMRRIRKAQYKPRCYCTAVLRADGTCQHGCPPNLRGGMSYTSIFLPAPNPVTFSYGVHCVCGAWLQCTITDLAEMCPECRFYMHEQEVVDSVLDHRWIP